MEPVLDSAFPLRRKNSFWRPAMSVAFIHLDLGIGGAENLVITAAKGLQDSGLSVTMFTSHHDRSRSFKETVDGTLKVRLIFST